MKIDFYISSLSGGGAEHVLRNIASNFAGRGIDVGIISYEKRPQFYMADPRVKVYKVDYTKRNKIMELLSDLRATRRHLKERKADVAVSFLSRCNFMLILTRMFTKTRVIVCDRNNLLRKYPRYIFAITCFLYRFADAICVQTNEIKFFYPVYLQKKLYVLENPLDFEEMNRQCEGQTIEKENAVISVGRLEAQKDFTTLICAFQEIARKYPDWKLKIYGQGEKKQELESLIRRKNLEQNVLLCGVTHTPFLEMKRAEIFVLSSFYEGFPNVLCEAMHAGLPCISTRCECGPSELIEDGKNGFLVPVGDRKLLSEKMEALILDEKKRRNMGKAAMQSTERLELNKISGKWLEMVMAVKGD